MAAPLLNGNSALIVKTIVGVSIAIASSAIGYNSSQIGQLWRSVDHKVDIANAPPQLYRDYVDTRLESIQDDVKETKELVKALTVALNKHIQDTR